MSISAPDRHTFYYYCRDHCAVLLLYNVNSTTNVLYVFLFQTLLHNYPMAFRVGGGGNLNLYLAQRQIAPWGYKSA